MSYNPPNTDIGEDRLDRAFISQRRSEEQALAQARTPISYLLLVIEDGEERIERFTCRANERATYVREMLGVELDNVPFALKSKTSEGRWAAAIGTDAELRRKLERMR